MTKRYGRHISLRNTSIGSYLGPLAISKKLLQGRRNEGRAKGGNADGKGNFGHMSYIYKVVDVNPQISKPRNSYNAEIKNLYAVVTISLQIDDNKWFTMLR